MSEPQTTVMFSKTDWDDLAVMVRLYKTAMAHKLNSDDSDEIIERRIRLARRITRLAR